MLLIDAGNSRIKWRLQGGTTGNAASLCELAQQFNTLGPVDRIVCASVRGNAFADKLQRLCRNHGWPLPEFLQATAESGGVRNGYDDVSQLGVDRWLAAVAAVQRYGAPVVVIDVGTAINVEYVDGSGVYRGGYIAPGWQRLLDSLNHGAALIDIAELKAPLPAVPGRNTQAAAGSGCGLMLAAFINRVCQDAADVPIVATGGGYPLVAAAVTPRLPYDPDLVFRGIELVCKTSAVPKK